MKLVKFTCEINIFTCEMFQFHIKFHRHMKLHVNFSRLHIYLGT
jgi:hypothetical protein